MYHMILISFFFFNFNFNNKHKKYLLSYFVFFYFTGRGKKQTGINYQNLYKLEAIFILYIYTKVF